MLQSLTEFRRVFGAIVNHSMVQTSIMTLIIINAIVLGLETVPSVYDRYGSYLKFVDRFILWIFVVELLLALIADGWKFFKKPWRIFDTVVVGIAFMPAMGPLSVLRSLRILRALRLISVSPKLRAVVVGLLAAIPGLSSIFAILLLIFYVFGVAATQLFAAEFPEWFGDLGRSMYTLFQVMTLESWSMGIVRPILEVYPFAWLFFVPFICIATFTMLNLFIAVIVNAMQSEHEETREQEKEQLTEISHELSHDFHKDMMALREELRSMRALIETQRGQKN